MKGIKKGLAVALAAAMVITSAQTGTVASAAKKPKLSTKKASVTVGKTTKISLKNGKKSAKVTWKTSKKAVAKIAKKSTKGNAAYATVKGVKAGKATITAAYKLGKKTTKLTCTVTVSAAKATDAPAVTSPAAVAATTASVMATATATVVPIAPTKVPVVIATASVAPTNGPATPTPTPKVTKTPGPTKGPTATPLPEGTATFAEVKNAIAVDLSGYTSSAGSSTYDAAGKRIVMDDQEGDNSQGSLALPASVQIKEGDLATFRVQGYYYGDYGFRFWIGSATSGGCTPIEVVTNVEEGRAVKEYPCVEGEGDAAVKVNQMPVNADKTTHAFDVTFTFKAGTSQNDTSGSYPNLTLKYIFDENENGVIRGLVLKNIYYLPDGVPKATAEPTEAPTAAPTATTVPPTTDPDATAAPTVDPDATAAPTVDPDATAAPETAAPSNSPEPTEVPVDATAVRTDKAITIDGDIDAAWDAAEFLDVAKYSGTAGATSAKAKIMWDDTNMYALVVVTDADIDATNSASYQQDGGEVFFDEDLSREKDYAVNTDAFQYRMSGFKKGENGVWAAPYTGFEKSKGTGYAVTSAYKVTTDADAVTGYVMEYAIPFAAAPEVDKLVGFDINVFDCGGGTRANEILLFKAGDHYGDAGNMGIVKLVEPEKKGVAIDLSKAAFDGTCGTYDAESKTIKVNDERTEGSSVVYIPTGFDIPVDSTIIVRFKGTSWGDNSFRTWATPLDGQTSGDFVTNNGIFLEPGVSAGQPFEGSVELTTKTKACSSITLKPGHGTRIKGLEISEISVEIVE